MTENLLESNALSVIIAILGLVIFFYAGYRIYTVASHSEEQKSAQNILDILNAKINALEDKKSVDTTLQGFPKAENWYLAGWNTDDPNRPDKCSFNNCICICKPASKPSTNIPADACKENGFCRDTKDFSVIIYTTDAAKNPSTEGGLKESNSQYIQLKNQIIKIHFDKSLWKDKEIQIINYQN